VQHNLSRLSLSQLFLIQCTKVVAAQEILRHDIQQRLNNFGIRDSPNGKSTHPTPLRLFNKKGHLYNDMHTTVHYIYTYIFLNWENLCPNLLIKKS
jgi:hypothetical protein